MRGFHRAELQQPQYYKNIVQYRSYETQCTSGVFLNSSLENQRIILQHHLYEIKQQIQTLESQPSSNSRLLNYYYDQYRQTLFLLEKLAPHLDGAQNDNTEAS